MSRRQAEPIREIATDTGHSRWRVVVDAGTHTDGRRRQVTSTHRTIREARGALARVRADVDRGVYVARDTETLDGLCGRWLDGRRDVRPVTVEGYRNVLAPVRRRLGHKRVQALTLADVDGLVTAMLNDGGQRGQALSVRSVAATLGALAQVIDLAMREGLVSRNVVRLVKRPRNGDRRELVCWSLAEAATFRAHALTDRYAAGWLLATCGLRRSEVLGLRWSDVDLRLGTVTVCQGRVAVTPSYDDTDAPKSAQSARTVPVGVILPGAVDVLRSFRARQAAERLRLGLPWTPDGLVIVNEAGEPVRPEWFSDRFRALSREAGVPVIRLHATRHTMAVELNRAGVAPVDAAALLGHTTEQYLSTYARAQSTGIGSAAAALGAAFSHASGN